MIGTAAYRVNDLPAKSSIIGTYDSSRSYSRHKKTFKGYEALLLPFAHDAE